MRKDIETGKLEWKINAGDGTSERLVPESWGLNGRAAVWLKGLVKRMVVSMEKAWRIGAEEPRKVVHCLKVGLALSLVSVFYYMRPLYEGVGGNSLWIVMTVVVVFEPNVASMATFSRFVPSFKARFDYGAMIFILTFSLVSVSGYRVDKLVALAQQRVSTIAIGTSICIVISIFFCPVWAGVQLHRLLQHNLEKLAHSLDGCVAEFFKEKEALTQKEGEEETNKKMLGFKCVLNSKGPEESMANLARWEPGHGSFNFWHPWKQYLKTGAAMRRCAYCLENLTICIISETEVPDRLKNHLREGCTKVGSASSKILRELATMMKKTRKSSNMDFQLFQLNSAVQELQETLKTVKNQTDMPEEDPAQDKGGGESRIVSISLHEVLPLATMVSLLIENATRIQEIVKEVEELANLACFKRDSKKKAAGPKLNNQP
ncbi:PREDICTED: aluminum-activated malate transporter 10 [Tarenaya hassleriana]|uniref:aluminum-activated malate transporter 10 n=1 Tax=Tarenaya hassleriana TaxID=28532 RepID=UPI00053CA096|nr:PREDICTED: aluminum-activated malate transporter 10 [Tarenaya hassleriana]